MEREIEIQKLVNVLRKTARMAQQAAWAGQEESSATYSVDQYNRVYKRLTELDESVATIFDPLDADASLVVVSMACRQLAAYFEDEVKSGTSWERIYGAAFDTESFKDFWKQSAKDIEDLGEFIRENLEIWAKQRKKKDASERGEKSEE